MPGWSFVMSGVIPMQPGLSTLTWWITGSKASFRTKSGEGRAVLVGFSASGSSWSKEQWFPKVLLPSHFHPPFVQGNICQFLERFLVVCLGKGCYWHLVGRDLGCYSTMHRTPQAPTELFSPKCLQCGGWETLESRKGEERSKTMLKSYSLIPVLPKTEMPNKSGTDPGGGL